MVVKTECTRVTGLHSVELVRTQSGYGFNVRGQTEDGGQLRSLNGRLYGPMQYVSSVLANSAACVAGVICGDRIVEVNGVCVEGYSHNRVVELIKSSNEKIRLLLLSLSPEDEARLECTTQIDLPSRYDYMERRSLPIVIPSYSTVTDKSSGEYTIFNICLNGKQLTSRRYSDFLELHDSLSRQFYDYRFPRFPSKQLLKMNAKKLEQRRRGLEHYLDDVCAVVPIWRCETLQAFLSYSCRHVGESAKAVPADNSHENVTVCLPDMSVRTLSVRRDCNSSTLCHDLLRSLSVSPRAYSCFSLFERVSSTFARRLRDNERVVDCLLNATHTSPQFARAVEPCANHAHTGGSPVDTVTMTTADLSPAVSAASVDAESPLLLSRWLFDVGAESRLVTLCHTSLLFLFHLAARDVSMGRLGVTEEQSLQLQRLQADNRQLQYLELVQTINGYGEITLESVRFQTDDSTIELNGSVSIGFHRISIKQASSLQGDSTIDAPLLVIDWTNIDRWTLSYTDSMFRVFLTKCNDLPQSVTIYTPYYLYLTDILERIKLEHDLA